MCTALRRRDVIDKAVAALRIRIIMLHRHLDIHTVSGSLTVNDILIQRSLALIQILYELANASLIVEDLLYRFLRISLIPKHNADIFRQECHLPQALL